MARLKLLKRIKEKLQSPFPTYESLKSLYIEYGGDEYCLWHDYGDAYIKACKKFNFTDEEKEKCKEQFKIL